MCIGCRLCEERDYGGSPFPRLCYASGKYKDASYPKGTLLIEFAYNSSYPASIGMAPYEALYGRKFRTPECWDEVGERKLCRSGNCPSDL